MSVTAFVNATPCRCLRSSNSGSAQPDPKCSRVANSAKRSPMRTITGTGSRAFVTMADWPSTTMRSRTPSDRFASARATVRPDAVCATLALEILTQKRKDKQAASRFFRKLLKDEGASPNKPTTDRLPSNQAAKRDIMPSVPLRTIERKSRMSERAVGSDRCENSSHPAKCTAFLQCTIECEIYFVAKDN